MLRNDDGVKGGWSPGGTAQKQVCQIGILKFVAPCRGPCVDQEPFSLCACTLAPANLMPKTTKAPLRLQKLLNFVSGAKTPKTNPSGPRPTVRRAFSSGLSETTVTWTLAMAWPWAPKSTHFLKVMFF